MTASGEAANAQIRASLKMTPGARLCGVNRCTVIIQGGAEGLRRHREVVHATEQWNLNEQDETWQS